MNNDYPLFTVFTVACIGMCTVMILGQYYDAVFREVKVQTVPCSVDIKEMARNLNVTLMDMCEVTE